MTSKYLFIIWGILSVFLLGSLAYADERSPEKTVTTHQPQATLPNPLSLTQALTYAKTHPWLASSHSKNPNQLFQPFYLNCHKLAYSNDSLPDHQRGHWFSPLFSPEAILALDILQRFFDVLLADQQAAYNNEIMASGFIRLDRIKNRQALNAASELNVAEKEALYQQLRQQRFASEKMQRLTRALLAQAIYSDKLPANVTLEKPLPKIPETLPNVDELYNAIQKIKNTTPTKSTDAKAEKVADSGQERKAINTPEQILLDMALRQFILERLLLIQQLTVAQEAAKSQTDWRDLKLDQSRTLYDFEVKSDLGDSMALQTQALLHEKQIHYCQILAWAELNALQQQPLLNSAEQSDPDANTHTQKNNDDAS
ncbi:MAG: hypothetical protein ACWA5U_02355 [bacterium]